MILVTLFVLGFLLDLLWFACVRVGSTDRAATAAVLSASFAAVVLFCSWQVIEARDWSQFAAYVFGQAAGAYAFMKVKTAWTKHSS